MAKYAINPEGVQALNQLANDLLINANNIVEANQKLEQIICALEDGLSIYSDEIVSIIHRNRQTLNSNRDDVVHLAQQVKKQAQEVESLIALGFEDVSASYDVRDGLNSNRMDSSNRTIANVIPGTPMDFNKADSGSVNPNYGNEKGYSINCQSCVVTFEARQRGYDVQVLPNTPGSMLEKLSYETNLAWIDPKTGQHPDYIFDDSRRTPNEYLDFICNVVKPGERYTLQFGWAGRNAGGHIVNLDRDEKGLLRIKDNQRGLGETSEWKGDFAVLDYLSRMKYEDKCLFGSQPCVPRLIRIDNMDFDYSVVDQIMKG